MFLQSITLFASHVVLSAILLLILWEDQSDGSKNKYVFD